MICDEHEIAHESCVLTSSTFTFWLGGVSHENFVFTSSTFSFWRKPRTKALFSGLQLSVFEGSLARRIPFHIYNFLFWGTSHRKGSFSELQLSVFKGGLPRKPCFHIFNFQFLREVSHKAFFWKIAVSFLKGGLAQKHRFANFNFQFLKDVWQESFVFTSATFCFLKEASCDSFVFRTSSFSFEGKSPTRCVFERKRMRKMLRFATQNMPQKIDGKGLPCDGYGTRLAIGRIILGSAPHWNWRFRRCFANLRLWVCDGRLARKLRFHYFNLHFWREVSHESFVLTTSPFSCRGKPRSSSQIHLSVSEGRLARKLRFTSLTISFWGKPERKLSFYIFNFDFLRKVSHERFVFASWSCSSIADVSRFWRLSFSF